MEMERVYMCIGPEGVSAWRGDASGCKEEFSASRHLSADDSLRHVEDVIYDHPGIIDDFSVTAFVDFGRFFLLPEDASPYAEDAAEMMFPSSGMDVGTVSCGEYCLVNLLPRGIKSFLERTFPGVTITHPAVPLVERFRRNPEGGRRMYLHRQDGFSYVMAFSGDRLLWLTEHATVENADSAYYLLDAWNILGFRADEDKLFISGSRSTKEELLPLMRRHIDHVVTYRHPDNCPSDTPLAVALAESGYKSLTRNEA